MDIAFIIPKRVNRGPVLVVLELVRQLLLHNHHCKVYYMDEGGELSFPCETEYLSFSQTIDFNRYDIVHTHGIRPDMYAFYHKPLSCKAKLVSTMHNYILRDLAYEYNKVVAQVFGRVWLWSLKCHDKIVTLSQDALGYYRSFLPESKLAYVYNTRSLDHTKVLPQALREQIIAFKGDSFLIGANAILTKRKGIDQLIKVLPGLPFCKLLVVGEGKEKIGLENLCVEMGVTDRVLFLGYQEDAYRFLPYYDLFAMPSRSEGFGLTILEAAQYHKRLLCSDVPIFRELLTEKETVFFTLENEESLRKAILYLKDHPEKGDCLYERYEQYFSPECFYRGYEKIYNSLLD